MQLLKSIDLTHSHCINGPFSAIRLAPQIQGIQINSGSSLASAKQSFGLNASIAAFLHLPNRTTFNSNHSHHNSDSPPSIYPARHHVLVRCHPPQEVPDASPYVNCLCLLLRQSLCLAQLLTSNIVKPLAPFFAAGTTIPLRP